MPSASIMLRGPSGLRCGPHINSELEIILVTSGEIDVVLGNVTITTREGEAVLILPYEPHCFIPRDNAVGRVFMFAFHIAEQIYSAGKEGLSSGKFVPSEKLFAYAKEQTARVEENPCEFNAKSLFFPLVSEFLTSHTPVTSASVHGLTVRRLTDYIRTNLQEKITLRHASAYLGINTASLSRLLKDYTGISFTDFVNNLRLEKAIDYLHNCDISITEAAYLSGFGSIRNFNRIFFDTLGITPREYKKQIRK